MYSCITLTFHRPLFLKTIILGTSWVAPTPCGPKNRLLALVASEPLGATFVQLGFMTLCRGKQTHPDLTDVEVDKLSVLVRHVAPEISSHEAVPPGVKGITSSKEAPRGRVMYYELMAQLSTERYDSSDSVVPSLYNRRTRILDID